jgi:hypothetical protein
MSRSLDDLSSDVRPLVYEVIACLVARGVQVMIVQTSRTLAEHEANLANGTSAVRLSKHLPRRLRGIIAGTRDDECADAIDLCPYETYQLYGPDKLHWATDDRAEAKAAWAAIIEEGERVGLRSGGRWHQPHDPGHLEWLFTGERYPDIPQTSMAFVRHGIHAA